MVFQNLVQDLFGDDVLIAPKASYLDVLIVEDGDFDPLANNRGRDVYCVRTVSANGIVDLRFIETF